MDFNATEGTDNRRSGGRAECDDQTARVRRHAASGGPNVVSGDGYSHSASGSHSISQETGCKIRGASTSESIGQASGGQDSGPLIDAAFDMIKKLANGGEVDEEEYKNIQNKLRAPEDWQKAHSEIKRERLIEELDKFFENKPMPIAHTMGFDKSIVEWSNIGYMLDDSYPEASGKQQQVGDSQSSSAWAYNAPPSDHAFPPSPWVHPQQCALKPDLLTASANLATFTGQPASAYRGPSRRVFPGIGISYLYASQASRMESRGDETTIVSSILSNYIDKGGVYGQDAAAPQSSRKKLSDHVVAEEDDETISIYKEEWNAMASLLRERRMDQKSFKEAMVDMETLIDLVQLSIKMAKYFKKTPKSILETFEMACIVSKLGLPRPQETEILTREEENLLARRLAWELLGVIPSYEDFPIPYMAGMDVPTEWFDQRFKRIDGFESRRRNDKVYKFSSIPSLWYVERQNLRICFVRPEFPAHEYAYYDDCTRSPSKYGVKVHDLLIVCAKSLPQRKILLAINPAVLRNYMIKFEILIQKIKENQLQQRRRMDQLFNQTLEVTKYAFKLSEINYGTVKASCSKRVRERALVNWNTFLKEKRVEVFRCLQRIIDIAQTAILMLIKYDDGWLFNALDMYEMLELKIPLFDFDLT